MRNTSFGLLAYGYSENIGDEIQSLAASQFLPRIDALLERDRLHWYAGRSSTFLILNGWFISQPHWPPPAALKPLFVSFFAQDPKGVIRAEYSDYYRQFEPIGCRSPATAEAFQALNIDAYFSGCLTLTLSVGEANRGESVYAVDIERDLFNSLVPEPVRRECVHFSHEFPDLLGSNHRRLLWRSHTLIYRALAKCGPGGLGFRNVRQRMLEQRHQLRTGMAREMLGRYRQAKLVITSRLHVALPCLALGTPVVLLRRGIATDPRFRALKDFVRHFDENAKTPKINWAKPEPNPDDFKPFAQRLRERCTSGVRRALGEQEAMAALNSETQRV